MNKIAFVLLIVWLMLASFLIGVATAFVYPQQCYELFIDKDYPCSITKK